MPEIILIQLVTNGVFLCKSPIERSTHKPLMFLFRVLAHLVDQPRKLIQSRFVRCVVSLSRRYLCTPILTTSLNIETFFFGTMYLCPLYTRKYIFFKCQPFWKFSLIGWVHCSQRQSQRHHIAHSVCICSLSGLYTKRFRSL